MAEDSKSGASQAPDAAPEPADVGSVLSLLRKGGDADAIKDAVIAHVKALAAKHGVEKYKILMLFDDRDEISEWHANRLYSAANAGNKSDILLLIHSRGGSIEPAYLISKTCMRLASGKFVVVVPRKAKSAATPHTLDIHRVSAQSPR